MAAMFFVWSSVTRFVCVTSPSMRECGLSFTSSSNVPADAVLLAGAPPPSPDV